MELLRLIVPVPCLLLATLSRGAPPAPFVAEPFGGTFTDVIGTETLPDGRVLAFERSGLVWIVRADGTRQATPVLDIHDEVGAWWACTPTTSTSVFTSRSSRSSRA
jgi:hypothetical protein